MITSLDRTHAGFYRCIVRNRMGALLQRQTEVQVACKYSGRLGAGWGSKRERACRVLTHHHALGRARSRPQPPTLTGSSWRPFLRIREPSLYD